MSAFVVNKEHINAMITAGLNVRYKPLRWWHNGKPHTLTHDNASTIGEMLLQENVKSVSYRYEDSEITNLPGKVNAEWIIPFIYRYTYAVPTAVEVIKIIQCYEYQSCEHDEWELSSAKSFCDALTKAQFDRLPGYDDAPWGWDKPITKEELWIRNE